MTLPAGCLIDCFEPLQDCACIDHLLIKRIPEINTNGSREEVLPRFSEYHSAIRKSCGLTGAIATAEQVHGSNVATVDTPGRVLGVDGLITQCSELVLGIYVADCCAVYIVDPHRRVIALLHSGKKGTEQQITRIAIEQMQSDFGSNPRDLIVQLSPCIRYPLYEIDFAAQICQQAKDAGVLFVHDCGICTGSNLDQYYSYRMEQGQTGRLFALLQLKK